MNRPYCKIHMFDLGHVGFCPYCRIDELQAENKELKQQVAIIEKHALEFCEEIDNFEAQLAKAKPILDAAIECDEYLSSNPLNQIGTDSILHKKLKAAREYRKE